MRACVHVCMRACVRVWGACVGCAARPFPLCPGVRLKHLQDNRRHLTPPPLHRITPNLLNPFNPDVKTLIHEAYRNDPGPLALSTKMWVDVLNTGANLRNNRTLAGLDHKGITVWRLLVTYKDTPAGCQITCEYVLGAPEKASGSGGKERHRAAKQSFA